MGKSKHQGKRTTKSRGDRRARRRANRAMMENIREGIEIKASVRKERAADTRGSYGPKILGGDAANKELILQYDSSGSKGAF